MREANDPNFTAERLQQRIASVETIETKVARFIKSLLDEEYEPVDISAALSAGASAVMADGEGDDD